MTFAYDAASRKIYKHDPRGNRCTYTYDAIGQLKVERYADGQRTSFVYDVVGNRTRMTDSVGVTSTIYDPRRLVTAQHAAVGGRITYAYDNASRRVLMRDPDNGRFTYSYDAADRLTRVLNPQNKRSTLGYDPLGRQTLQQHGNGARTTQVYDAVGRIMVQDQADGIGLTRRTTYSYDPVGRRTLGNESTGVRSSWSYDVAGQLVREARGEVTITGGGLPCPLPFPPGTAGSTSFAGFITTHVYDPAGNRMVLIDSGIRTTATYDAANELLVERVNSARTTYQYDPNGNRTRKETPFDLTLYNWDVRNRLGSAEPLSARVTNTYNGDGLRVKKQVGADTRQYLYDFEKVLRESDGGGALENEYTSTTEQYGDLLSAYGDGSTSYYEGDPQYSTETLLDDNQSVTDRYRYRAFGLATHTQGSSTNSREFAGKQGYIADPQLELLYVRNRYYDPLTARWTSEDREGYNAGDPNLYRYCFNDPVNGIDPSGNILFYPKDNWKRSFDELSAWGLKEEDLLISGWDDYPNEGILVKSRSLLIPLDLQGEAFGNDIYFRSFRKALFDFKGSVNAVLHVRDKTSLLDGDSEIGDRAKRLYSYWHDDRKLLDRETLASTQEFTTFGELCEDLKKEFPETAKFIEQVTDFLQFANKFSNNIVNVSRALLHNPSGVFDTFWKGTIQGYTRFFEKIMTSETWSTILGGWLLGLGPTTSFTDLLKKLAAMWDLDEVWESTLSELPSSEMVALEELVEGDVYSLLTDKSKGDLDVKTVLMALGEEFVKYAKDYLIGEVFPLLKVPEGLTEAFVKSLELFRRVGGQAKQFLEEVDKGAQALIKGEENGFAEAMSNAMIKEIPLLLKLLEVLVLKKNISGEVKSLVDKLDVRTWFGKAVNVIKGKLRLGRPHQLGKEKTFTYQPMTGQSSKHETWVEWQNGKATLHFSSPRKAVVTKAGPLAPLLNDVETKAKVLDNEKKKPAADKKAKKDKGGRVKTATGNVKTAVNRLTDKASTEESKPSGAEKVEVESGGKTMSLKEFFEQCQGGTQVGNASAPCNNAKLMPGESKILESSTAEVSFRSGVMQQGGRFNIVVVKKVIANLQNLGSARSREPDTFMRNLIKTGTLTIPGTMLGLPTDDVGHIIGNQFGGYANKSMGNGNVFPQDQTVNRVEVNQFETNTVAKKLKDGCVCIELEFFFEPSSKTYLRPTHYTHQVVGQRCPAADQRFFKS